jgi:hypothetical protein
MEEDRIDKSEYKEAVKKEKRKLFVHVVILTAFAAAISLTFFMTLKNSNPYATTSGSI